MAQVSQLSESPVPHQRTPQPQRAAAALAATGPTVTELYAPGRVLREHA